MSHQPLDPNALPPLAPTRSESTSASLPEPQLPATEPTEEEVALSTPLRNVSSVPHHATAPEDAGALAASRLGATHLIDGLSQGWDSGEFSLLVFELAESPSQQPVPVLMPEVGTGLKPDVRRQVVLRIQEALNPQSEDERHTVARIGPGRFVVFLPLTEADDAQAKLEHVLTHLNHNPFVSDETGTAWTRLVVRGAQITSGRGEPRPGAVLLEELERRVQASPWNVRIDESIGAITTERDQETARLLEAISTTSGRLYETMHAAGIVAPALESTATRESLQLCQDLLAFLDHSQDTEGTRRAALADLTRRVSHFLGLLESA